MGSFSSNCDFYQVFTVFTSTLMQFDIWNMLLTSFRGAPADEVAKMNDFARFLTLDGTLRDQPGIKAAYSSAFGRVAGNIGKHAFDIAARAWVRWPGRLNYKAAFITHPVSHCSASSGLLFKTIVPVFIFDRISE
jgi:hypothetical protein